jgi:endonuclease/exonuclease/phosphatase family metal-dependent hydrolase
VTWASKPAESAANAPAVTGARQATARLATLNMWGTRGDWSARRALLSSEFAALSPDLVTLQESIVTARYDQAREVLGESYRLIHQADRESDGQGVTTATRWPIGQVLELDLHLTERTAGFASMCLITEIFAPEPLGRIWLANHLPDWQLDHEHERELQAVLAGRTVERLVAEHPGHVLVACDFDADPDATSTRFWTGRHSLDGLSVCYRDAWISAHPGERGHTFVPCNPNSADWDWPNRRIDYILVRCGPHGGPTLKITRCDQTFDQPDTIISDHYGLVADLELPPTV